MSERREMSKVGGLDLSRRDLNRDLDLDPKKKSVSTVEIFLTVWKTTSWQFKNQVSTVSTTLKIEISRFLLRSRRQKKSVSTVEIFSTVWKTTSRRVETSRSRLVSTVETPNLRDESFRINAVLGLGVEWRTRLRCERTWFGFYGRIKTRSSRTGVVCATVCATPHPNLT